MCSLIMLMFMPINSWCLAFITDASYGSRSRLMQKPIGGQSAKRDCQVLSLIWKNYSTPSKDQGMNLRQKGTERWVGQRREDVQQKSVFWICRGLDTHKFPAAMLFCLVTAQNQIHQCPFRMRERLTRPHPAQSDYLQFIFVGGGHFHQSFSFI